MRWGNAATITALILARVTADAAGADVRARLGAGAASALMADQLQPGAPLLPARPLLALDVLPTGTDGPVDRSSYRWWIYDDPEQGTARIDALAAALALAYDGQRVEAHRMPPPIAAMAIGPLSAPRRDDSLGLVGRALSLTATSV